MYQPKKISLDKNKVPLRPMENEAAAVMTQTHKGREPP
jgi:hypothetical protein